VHRLLDKSAARPHPEVSMSHVEDTIPYPWPFDGGAGLVAERAALVVCGLQRHWAATNEPAVRALVLLADALRHRGVLVVFVCHARVVQARRPGPDLPAIGSSGAAMAATPDPRDVVIDTHTHDGFLGSRMEAELVAHGRDHLLFAGFAAETLVDSTLRSANDRGFECLTLDDATIPFDPGTGACALASITMSGGIFGAVGSTRAVVAAYGASEEEELSA
jgi:biuret amidohydrolase